MDRPCDRVAAKQGDADRRFLRVSHGAAPSEYRSKYLELTASLVRQPIQEGEGYVE